MSTARLPRRSPLDPLAVAEGTRPKPETVADLLERLGDIPAHRVRWTPTPGTATEEDLVIYNESPLAHISCELIDGTLVERAVGFEESEVGILIAMAIGNFVYSRKLGRLLGEGGMQRLFPGMVRIPDVSFISYARFPRKNPPKGAIAPVVGDLVVEVLSKSNTKKEIEGKLRDYFAAGTRLAWVVDPKKKTVRVHTSPSEFVLVAVDGTLDGGDVLPGLVLPVRDFLGRD